MFNSQNAANAISTYAQTRITAYRKPQAWIGRAFVNGIVISDATVTVNASSYREARRRTRSRRRCTRNIPASSCWTL